MKRIALLIAWRLLAQPGIYAQTDSIPKETNLQEILVVAQRASLPATTQASFITLLEPSILQNARGGFSLNEVMPYAAGVNATNAENFAQDIKVSIRGFGARSAFGIRGIRIYLDDLPETSPDGQSQVDNLLLGALSRMAIIKGNAASTFGNAAGGALLLETPTPDPGLSIHAGTLWGSYGLQQHQLQWAYGGKKNSALVHSAWQQSKGYREGAAMKSTIHYGKWSIQLKPNHQLTWLSSFAWSPQADDAGALTLQEATANRRAARSANLQFQAGESLWQWRNALVYHGTTHHQWKINARLFRTDRDFENTLPVQAQGIIAFRRAWQGATLQAQRTFPFARWTHRLITGMNAESQTDDRTRHDNLQGIRGALKTNQKETFTNLAAYLHWHAIQQRHWLLETGHRLDVIHLKAADAFLTDGDQSGSSQFAVWSSHASAGWNFNPRWYTGLRWATHFETPTLNELSNRPDGLGGFNPDLKVQHSHQWEWLLKSRYPGIEWTTAFFYIRLKNELVPYEANGRTVYRNAGNSTRIGLETEGFWMPSSTIALRWSFTWNDFRFTDYPVNNTNFRGNRLTGIPELQGFLETRFEHPSGFLVFAQYQYLGNYFADDSNTTKIQPVQLVHLNLGHRFKAGKAGNLQVFGALNNLLDQKYFANIRVNAQGGRYYEPASGRTWQLGLKWEFHN